MTIDYSKFDQESSWEPSNVYLEGGDAYTDGIPSFDNPYQEGTPEREGWDHGWYDAEGNHLYGTGQL